VLVLIGVEMKVILLKQMWKIRIQGVEGKGREVFLY
jgi:hypothetical protein